MQSSHPAGSPARDGAPTLPPPVDRDAFLRTIAAHTGAAPLFVRVALDQLVRAGDCRCEPDPRMPSGWAVTPNPSMARHLADAGHPTTTGAR